MTNDIRRNIFLCGLGGQGIVFLTRLLAQTAVSLGWPVMVSETHGMSQRGGSVVSHLKIGGNQAPLIPRGRADLLLALDPDEALRYLTYLKPGGAAFVNVDAAGWARRQTEALAAHLERLHMAVHTIPAAEMALEMGVPAVANVILAGFALAHDALPLPLDAVRDTLRRIAPRSPELNLQALELGLRAGQTVAP